MLLVLRYWLPRNNSKCSKDLKNSAGGVRPPHGVILRRRSVQRPTEKTPRTPALYWPWVCWLVTLPGPGPQRAYYRNTRPGRTAQAIRSTARVFFFPQAGKSAPVGVRTPYLRVPPVVPQPTGLTTFGKFSKDLICIVYFVGQHFLESLIWYWK